MHKGEIIYDLLVFRREKDTKVVKCRYRQGDQGSETLSFRNLVVLQRRYPKGRRDPGIAATVSLLSAINVPESFQLVEEEIDRVKIKEVVRRM